MAQRLLQPRSLLIITLAFTTLEWLHEDGKWAPTHLLQHKARHRAAVQTTVDGQSQVTCSCN
jgi:hypothetical protein